MKILFKLLILTLLVSCSRKNDIGLSEQLNNTKWLVTDYKSNGTADPIIVSQQHTYEFRSDGNVYFSQVSPIYKDTLQYEILSNSSIKLTKPSLSAVAIINLQVDLINDAQFNFTLTSNLNGDIDSYKTTRQ